MSRTATRAVPDENTSELTSEQLLDARRWVQAARASAIERFPYLDVALTSMVPVAVVGLGTVATDARWRFYYDPVRVLQTAQNQRLDLGVSDWVHEVGHLLRDHPQRWIDMGEGPQWQRLFNVAGDAVINRDVEDMGLLLVPTDVTFQSLPDQAEVEVTMTTEEIYTRLRSRTSEDSSDGGDADKVPIGNAEPRDCGSGSGGERRPWEQPIDDSDGRPIPQDGSVDPDRGDLIRFETADQVRAHVRTQGSGSVPQSLREWSDSVLEPLVDWRRELRAAVSRALSQAAGRRDYSWSRPPRRRVPGYSTPGMAAPAPPSVAVVVDTSGSMSPDDLAQCIADIAALTRSVAGAAGGTPVRVIPCDMQAGPVSLVRTKADVPRIELTGGGGTDMRVGIEAAAGLQPTPEVIVILTDGFTLWPEAPVDPAPRAACIAVVVTDEAESGRDQMPDWITMIAERQSLRSRGSR